MASKFRELYLHAEGSVARCQSSCPPSFQLPKAFGGRKTTPLATTSSERATSMREQFAACSRSHCWTRVPTLKMKGSWEEWIWRKQRTGSLSRSGVRSRPSMKLSFKKCFLAIRCTVFRKQVAFLSLAPNPWSKIPSRYLNQQNLSQRHKTFLKRMEYSVKVIKLRSTKTKRALLKFKTYEQEKTRDTSTKFCRTSIWTTSLPPSTRTPTWERERTLHSSGMFLEANEIALDALVVFI